MYKLGTINKDHDSIIFCFKTWENKVQNKDFDSAKNLFGNDVVSSGTWMNVVEGLDKLCANQWKSVWPTINNFKFLTDTLYIQISPDKLLSNSILILGLYRL